MFQSYHSSIKTGIDEWDSPENWISFNPTIVRLKRLQIVLKKKGMLCFNPTIVRLKQVGHSCLDGHKTFQSYHSSIKTRLHDL